MYKICQFPNVNIRAVKIIRISQKEYEEIEFDFIENKIKRENV